MTRLVDTHTHLQAAFFEDDGVVVLERALMELAWLVVVGTDLDSSRQAVAMTRERVYAAVGLHPHDAEDCSASALDTLRTMADEPGVVALGEIGLDYFRMRAPQAAQRAAFDAQLALAAELGLPVIVHCRDAHADMVEVLEATHANLAGGVMHCFSGDAAFAAKCVDWGFHVSFAGNVTFPKAQPLRDAAAAVPLQRLLVETDCPFLAPQPVRGQRCEPQHVRHTAACLAEIKGVELDEFAAQTTQNAQRLFGVNG